jgi:hypothetical protein
MMTPLFGAPANAASPQVSALAAIAILAAHHMMDIIQIYPPA